nr:LPS assembly protein LptD [Roseateles koreensis]
MLALGVAGLFAPAAVLAQMVKVDAEVGAVGGAEAGAEAGAKAEPVRPPASPRAHLRLRASKKINRPGAADRQALVISADKLQTQVAQESRAEGHVELRYGELLLRSQKLSYEQVNDLARATGDVEVSRGGTLFRGPALSLYVSRFEGEFLNPTYFFSLTGGSGKADSVSFSDAKHMSAVNGSYSSCPVTEEKPQQDWQITADKLVMDLDANEGVASGAVLRFYGVPILGAPTMSFPLGLQRKSGWLPPNISFDSRSGLEFGLPYYWNIAPQRDATLTPFIMTQRGVGLDSEFRYLEPEHRGQVNWSILPNDRATKSSRWALDLLQDGEAPLDSRYRVRAERVSDDEYWKDLPKRMQSQTQRLLLTDLQLNRNREGLWGETNVYARVQRWQVLQGTDTLASFDAPYQRSPQLGVRFNTAADDAVLDGFVPWVRRTRLEGALEMEYNRFDLPSNAQLSPAQLKNQAAGLLYTGQRAHVLAHLSAPMGGAAWWLIPRVALNAVQYSLDQPMTDGRSAAHRTIPTFSLDHGWVFERDSSLFGRRTLQTLEPRLLYVNTPYRDQSGMPNFDSAPKDFNFDSIYTENQFSGVDRVNDANQLTFGLSSRWIDAGQGEEVLRLGAVQRYLFNPQRLTSDGSTVDQRLSDLLLLASAHVMDQWWADGSVQINPDAGRSVRTVMRARYSPGPFRTISTAYRLARGQSEQLELAWQWPLYGHDDRIARKNAGGGACSGAWYSAGRVQYSLSDRRLTDSVMGVEYDAGCWILRIGAERQSTGLREANTRLMLQMEFVGLSQLGSNALNVLRDNIPGYRSLSGNRSASPEASYD